MNKEQLRKEVIEMGSFESQLEVVEWLESVGEEIYDVTKYNIERQLDVMPSMEYVKGYWIRRSKPSTITLENAKLKYKNNMKYEVTRKELQEIYPNVCSTWQTEINKVASVNPLADTFEVSSELIRKAYGEANEDQKKWLNKVFPNFLPKLQVGKWYDYEGAIICYQGETQYLQAFGVRQNGSWMDIANCGNSPFLWKEATEEQVLDVLTKEAKRRGLIEGVRVDFEVRKDDIRTLKGEYELNLASGWFSMGGYILFHFNEHRTGEWNDKIVKEPEIDYSRLKTGSKVMIRYSMQCCGSLDKVDLSEPFEIVFYRTPHLIGNSNQFIKSGYHGEYITLHQEGNYILFTSDIVIDYITKVIEY